MRETVPDCGDRARRRDRAGRPHARGADRAPAGRQGLSAGARRGRAQPLLPDREPVRAARGRAPRGRRGGRDQAARVAVRPEQELLGTREDRPELPAARPRRSRSACSPSSRRSPTPSASSAAPRARRSGSTASSTSSTSGPTGASRNAQEREQLEALRRLAAVLGAHLLLEEGDDVAEIAARVARERGTTYVLMGVPSGRRGLRRLVGAAARPAAQAAAGRRPQDRRGSR